jgi:hypothetical protein
MKNSNVSGLERLQRQILFPLLIGDVLIDGNIFDQVNRE